METQKSIYERLEVISYLGLDIEKGIDIGPGNDCLPGATPLEADDYDGFNLPYEDNSLDYVYSSHVLEHQGNPMSYIHEWFRPVKLGGILYLVVPHKFLYERKLMPPSRWNGQHRVFFTPADLMNYVEMALPPNSYRVVLLSDNDKNYDYSIPQEQHPQGCYEIELILRKIRKPDWGLIK